MGCFWFVEALNIILIRARPHGNLLDHGSLVEKSGPSGLWHPQVKELGMTFWLLGMP